MEISSADVGRLDLVQLIYRSRSLLHGPQAEINAGVGEILEISRRNNPLHGVTGVLFFDGFNFVQTLEGPPRAIEALYGNISRDSRHENIVLLDHAVVGERCFEAWAMAFVGRGDDPTFRIPSGFLGDIVAGHSAAGTILEMMAYFLQED